MKIKSLIISIILTLSATSLAAHAKTDVTGEAFSKVFSSIKMKDTVIPYSVSIDDINAGEDCDNATQTCLLKGFSWSDVTGWMHWNGKELQNELGGALNFPDEYIAKATYKGGLSGFIWGEKFGWIQLSACAGIDSKAVCQAKTYCSWSPNNYCETNKSGLPPAASTQTANDWGVYVDFCPLKTDQASCESSQSDSYCNWDPASTSCLFDVNNNPNGQPIKGFAWSQYLGWIKFGPDMGESDFSGVFTRWYPDLSPPVLIPLDPQQNNNGNGVGAFGVEEGKVWIPNESPLGTIHWLSFAQNSGSPLDLIKSFITVNTDSGQNFVGCPLATLQMNGNVILSESSGTGVIDVSIPQIGLIGAPPHGFCAYTLEGALYNSSGFGYYFGNAGAQAALADGIDLTLPDPAIYNANPITLYVRAGDLSLTDSSLTIDSNGSVGDGTSADPLIFSPKDNAGNPIIPVKSSLVPGSLPEPLQANWVRDVKTFYDFNPASEYYFDRVDVSRNFINAYPIPVEIEGQLFGFTDSLSYPPSGLSSLPNFGGNYLLDVKGFAPTTLTENKLELSSITVETVDASLPAASPMMGPWNSGATTQIDTSSPLPSNPLPHLYALKPALDISDGKLDTNVVSIGQPVQASYTLVNHSNNSLNAYGLDHVISFTDTGGIGSELLELNNINLNGLNDTAGRTDPDSGITRYGLLFNSGSEGFNQFHNLTQNYHTPSYSFVSSLNDNSGVYQVNGNYFTPPGAPCLTSPPCPAVDIDRSDLLNSPLQPQGSLTIGFSLTPSQYTGNSMNAQVSMGIDQYLAYHTTNNPFPQFAIYPAPITIDNIEVKSIGLGTSGIVSGDQIFESVSGRNLDVLSLGSAADVRREIRKNVAILSRNITPCSAPLTLSSLSVAASSCISVDEINKTVVAVYSGPGLITLDNGNNPITVPDDYKYTIILLKGASLNIASNLSYGNSTQNSLGMMVMQDQNGNGGNVYLAPEPTNLVGLLYAEGSLLSSPDGGSTFYYGGGADSNDLKNQLFWQGAIVSSNTIGAGPSKIVPSGVSCQPWNNDVSNCALAYDLDFIRRFTTVHAEPENVDFSPSDYKFSGGGACSPGLAADPGCFHGPLPTTVTLNGASIDVSASKSLDTFFIERVSRPVPPGFSSGGGLSSSQDIR